MFKPKKSGLVLALNGCEKVIKTVFVVFFSARPQESDDDFEDDNDDDDNNDDNDDMSLMQPKTGANKSWKESNKTERKYEKEK